MSREAVIVGGGVSGVTVGIILRLLDIPTRIICRHWIEDADSNPTWLTSEPRFASQYPAASVIPHTVQINEPLWHARCNKRVFDVLISCAQAGLRRQRHYEIFEEPTQCAPEIAEMPEFKVLPSDGTGEAGAPRRSDACPIFGWSFQVLFAEMQIYRRFIGGLYRALGGILETGRYVTLSELTRPGIETIINCGGAWGPGLTGDPESSRFVQGSLVRVDIGGLLPRSRISSEVVSYNYHPVASVYSSPQGSPADVYCYPRYDGLLLGGTRFESEELTPDDSMLSDGCATWRGERWTKETIDTPLIAHPQSTSPVPAPIITLNRTLLLKLIGLDVDAYPKAVMTGYRHKRTTTRLEQSVHDSTQVIHNYGHGGAGVTLSWSCAIKVASMVLGRDVSIDEIESLLAPYST